MSIESQRYMTKNSVLERRRDVTNGRVIDDFLLISRGEGETFESSDYAYVSKKMFDILWNDHKREKKHRGETGKKYTADDLKILIEKGKKENYAGLGGRFIAIVYVDKTPGLYKSSEVIDTDPKLNASPPPIGSSGIDFREIKDGKFEEFELNLPPGKK